jgi:hypothetical protein
MPPPLLLLSPRRGPVAVAAIVVKIMENRISTAFLYSSLRLLLT